MDISNIESKAFTDINITLSILELRVIKERWQAIMSITKQNDRVTYQDRLTHNTQLIEFNVFMDKLLIGVSTSEDVTLDLFTNDTLVSNNIEQVLESTLNDPKQVL